MSNLWIDFLREMPDELWDGIERGQPQSFPPPSIDPGIRVWLRESIMGGAPPQTTSSPRNVDPRAHAEAMRDQEERERLERMRRQAGYPWSEPQE